MAEEEDEKPKVKITDKRGKRDDDSEKKESEEPKVLGDEGGVHLGSVDDDDLAIDFGNFLMSLAHSALINLGVVEHPESGEKQVDLPSAKQTIEIIEMLKEKTTGNLDEDEQKLIGSLLYELRISFVNASAQNVTS